MKFSLLMAAFALIMAFPLTAKAFDNEKMPKLQAASETMEAEMSDPAIKAVMFYSDTCGSCKILDPRVTEAMAIINPEKIELVKFDFSNKETITATRALATSKNIDGVLQEFGAKTGFVVLVNNKGEVVERLTKKDETADIAGKLAMSIANAS